MRASEEPRPPDRPVQRRHAAAGLVTSLILVATTIAAQATPANVAVTPAVPPGRAYQQRAIAADPTRSGHLAAAVTDVHRLDTCYVAMSRDGGATWSTEALVGRNARLSLPQGLTHCWQPTLDFGPDGSLYYLFQTAWPPASEAGPVRLTISRDGGETWTEPATIHPSEQNRTGFFPSIAVDDMSGRVYVGYASNGELRVASSEDGGRTFSAPVAALPPGERAFGLSMAVGPDGALSVAYLDLVDTTLIGRVPHRLRVGRSSDRGRTFRYSTVDTVDPGCVSFMHPDHMSPFPPFSCEPLGSMSPATIAAGPEPGLVTVVWHEGERGGIPIDPLLIERPPNRIYLSSSTDGGATFGPVRLVPPREGAEAHQQHSPGVTFTPDGRIHLAFYDLGTDHLQHVYATASSDGGATFSPAARVTDVASDTRIGPRSQTNDHAKTYGGPIAVASAGTSAHAAWTDSRRGTEADAHQDVFTARLP